MKREGCYKGIDSNSSLSQLRIYLMAKENCEVGGCIIRAGELLGRLMTRGNYLPFSFTGFDTANSFQRTNGFKCFRAVQGNLARYESEDIKRSAAA